MTSFHIFCNTYEFISNTKSTTEFLLTTLFLSYLVNNLCLRLHSMTVWPRCADLAADRYLIVMKQPAQITNFTKIYSVTAFPGRFFPHACDTTRASGWLTKETTPICAFYWFFFYWIKATTSLIKQWFIGMKHLDQSKLAIAQHYVSIFILVRGWFSQNIFFSLRKKLTCVFLYSKWWLWSE